MAMVPPSTRSFMPSPHEYKTFQDKGSIKTAPGEGFKSILFMWSSIIVSTQSKAISMPQWKADGLCLYQEDHALDRVNRLLLT